VSQTTKGVILEVKKERTGTFLECILYDGKLKLEDKIAIASLDDETITTKIRIMQEARPLNKGYETKKEVHAASGIKIQIISKENILPGMPFQVINNNLEEIKKEFENEISEEIQTDESGIIVKADSLGSLEALLFLLRQDNIKVLKAGIGSITKKDIYAASALPELDKIIIGFNVEITNETEVEELNQIKIITNKVVYKLIEDLKEYSKQKTREIEKRKLNELPKIAKITVLDFVFRNSSPAVFGVVVNGGMLHTRERLINSNDVKIGQIKEIQEDRKSVGKAEKNAEVAVSIPGVNFERQLKKDESLYTNLSETEFRKFKEHKNLLTSDEKTILQEIATIKRRTNSTWGI
jgi:translation initiation factor 5B